LKAFRNASFHVPGMPDAFATDPNDITMTSFAFATMVEKG
jgi:hypothetical protein